MVHNRSGYSRGCRCGICTEAHRDYQRDYYRRIGGNPYNVRAIKNLCAGGCGKFVRRSAQGKLTKCRACNAAPKFIPAERIERAKARALARTTGEPRSKFKPSRIFRLAIYERDNWTCQLCTQSVDANLHYLDDWAASLDHIICRSKGGTDDPSNLRLAHRWCNSVRGDETYYGAEFFAA